MFLLCYIKMVLLRGLVSCEFLVIFLGYWASSHVEQLKLLVKIALIQQRPTAANGACCVGGKWS